MLVQLVLSQVKHKNERFQGRPVLLLARAEVGGDAGQSGVDLLLFDGSFSDLDSECVIEVCTALQWCFPARDLG